MNKKYSRRASRRVTMMEHIMDADHVAYGVIVVNENESVVLPGLSKNPAKSIRTVDALTAIGIDAAVYVSVTTNNIHILEAGDIDMLYDIHHSREG